jgi:hypothetical protein
MMEYLSQNTTIPVLHVHSWNLGFNCHNN